MFRNLERDEIERVWAIDRREIVENVYHMEDGKLVMRPEYHDIQGWPPGEPEDIHMEYHILAKQG